MFEYSKCKDVDRLLQLAVKIRSDISIEVFAVLSCKFTTPARRIRFVFMFCGFTNTISCTLIRDVDGYRRKYSSYPAFIREMFVETEKLLLQKLYQLVEPAGFQLIQAACTTDWFHG